MTTIAAALTVAADRVEFRAEGRPRYRIAGTKIGVPGVTTILGQTVNKGGLTWWSAKLAVETVRAHLDNPNPAASWDNVLDEAYRAHDRVKREKGNVGTIAHDCIHAWAVGDPFDTYMPDEPESANATRAALAFLKEHVKDIQAAEARVVAPDLSWAGTLDLIAYVDGLLTVIDWKTSKSLYREQAWQAAAYATGTNAALEAAGLPDRVEQTAIVRCCRETGTYKVLFTTDWKADAEAFERCALNYRQLQDTDKRIKQAEAA